MARVTKDTMIGELLQIDANVAPMLLNIGMHWMPIFSDGDSWRGCYGSRI